MTPRIHPLTQAVCENAKPAAKQRITKLQDGAGLFLQIERRPGTDTITKGWRFRYSNNGKDALMSLGVFPGVSLAEARERADAQRQLIRRGESPALARQRHRDDSHTSQVKTFGVVAREYNASPLREAKEPKTRDRDERMFRHSKPLHGRTFTQIERPDILTLCRSLEAAGRTDTVHRLGIYMSAVFRFARDEGYFKGVDPTHGGFGGSLKPVKETHRPALTDLKSVGVLMRIIEDNSAWIGFSHGVVRALNLLARTVVRPGELAAAQWSEFDLTGEHHDGHPTWAIPRARMKEDDAAARTEFHIVPLSRQAVDILKTQHALTSHSPYVFPNQNSDRRPMTDSTLPRAMVGLGYRGQHTPHGFRTTFRTLGRDKLKADRELLERQLDHKVGNAVEGAYDRSQRLDERREVMQRYSDLLDKLRDA